MTGQRRFVKDWRSTGRKRGRKVLYEEGVSFKCNNCDRTVIAPPPDAPEHFEELWPTERRELQYSLQVNHINKDYTDNDPSNLEWLCALCHKYKDSQTSSGTIDYTEYGNEGI